MKGKTHANMADHVPVFNFTSFLIFNTLNYDQPRGLVVRVSTTNHEVPGHSLLRASDQ